MPEKVQPKRREAKKCAKCGANNNENNKTCIGCGTAI